MLDLNPFLLLTEDPDKAMDANGIVAAWNSMDSVCFGVLEGVVFYALRPKMFHQEMYEIIGSVCDDENPLFNNFETDLQRYHVGVGNLTHDGWLKVVDYLNKYPMRDARHAFAPCGRTWKDADVISLWDTRAEAVKSIRSLELVINTLTFIDPKEYRFEFIDDKDKPRYAFMQQPESIVNYLKSRPLLNDLKREALGIESYKGPRLDRAAIEDLMKKQHLDPVAKKGVLQDAGVGSRKEGKRASAAGYPSVASFKSQWLRESLETHL